MSSISALISSDNETKTPLSSKTSMLVIPPLPIKRLTTTTISDTDGTLSRGCFEGIKTPPLPSFPTGTESAGEAGREVMVGIRSETVQSDVSSTGFSSSGLLSDNCGMSMSTAATSIVNLDEDDVKAHKLVVADPESNIISLTQKTFKHEDDGEVAVSEAPIIAAGSIEGDDEERQPVLQGFHCCVCGAYNRVPSEYDLLPISPASSPAGSLASSPSASSPPSSPPKYQHHLPHLHLPHLHLHHPQVCECGHAQCHYGCKVELLISHHLLALNHVSRKHCTPAGTAVASPGKHESKKERKKAVEQAKVQEYAKLNPDGTPRRWGWCNNEWLGMLDEKFDEKGKVKRGWVDPMPEGVVEKWGVKVERGVEECRRMGKRVARKVGQVWGAI